MAEHRLKVILLFVYCNNTNLKLHALQGERWIEDANQNPKIEQKGSLFCETQDCFTCGSLSDFSSCWCLLCPEVEPNSNELAIVILNVVGEKSGGMKKIYWSM